MWGMQNEHVDHRYLRLGRALYGVYNVHSGGLAWNGAPVPAWSEIRQREHDAAGTYDDRRDDPRGDGVLAHWRAVAMEVSTVPEHADALARSIEDRFAENEVYQRVTS